MCPEENEDDSQDEEAASERESGSDNADSGSDVAEDIGPAAYEFVEDGGGGGDLEYDPAGGMSMFGVIDESDLVEEPAVPPLDEGVDAD